MRFEELLERWETGRPSHSEAAAALGVSERTFRRWRGRHAEEGAAGLADRRVGKPSPRRAPVDELQRMLRLCHEHCVGFAIRHFHDVLRRRHGYRLGCTTTRLWLQKSGAVAVAPRRGAHRRKRPRRPMVGMMLHQDASTHAWLAGQPPLDLVITIGSADPSTQWPAPLGAGGDDATSALCSAVPVDQEGTASSFRGLAEVIEHHGLLIGLRTDRAQRARSGPAGTAAGRRRRRAATVSTPRKPAGRFPGPSSPKSAGRSSSSASATSPPTRRRPAGAASGRSARSRTGCRRSCGSAGSPAWRRPSATCARSICPSTTPAARRPPRAAGPGLRQGAGRAVARGAVRPGGAPGRQRQLRALAGPRAADPAQPAAAALRARDGKAARTSGRRGDHLRRPAPSGQLRAGSRAIAGPGRVTAAPRPGRWGCGQRSALPTTPPAQQQRPTHA